MQEVGNCDKLQYVQSMEIDDKGVMWVVDASDVFNTSGGVCPPKVVLIDVATGSVVETYTFPQEVVTVGSSFLNDIVIDITNQVGYLSDLKGGQIVVYDRRGKRSRVWSDESCKAQPVDPMLINDVVYPSGPSAGLDGVDGIALEPCGKHLYFCTLQGTMFFRVDASLLRNFSATDEAIRATLWQTEKPGMADGATFDQNGKLYFGAISNSTAFETAGSAVYSYSPRADTMTQEARDSSMLHWADTFAFDDQKGGLLLVSNRLDLFFDDIGKYWDASYNTADSPDVHIIRMPISARSYIWGQAHPDELACTPSSDDGAAHLSSVAPKAFLGTRAAEASDAETAAGSGW